MTRIETNFETLKNDIAVFYKPDLHHFITMNAVDLGNDEIEYQWFFCDYAYPCAETVFVTKAAANITVPSIREVVEPAWVAEAEICDLMGVEIENAEKGFMLEVDSDAAPLRKKKK
jgi:NADH:ubiquinone oxidoreductase subunit C